MFLDYASAQRHGGNGDFGSGAAMSSFTCARLSTFGSALSGLGRSRCWSTPARSCPMVARNLKKTRMAASLRVGVLARGSRVLASSLSSVVSEMQTETAWYPATSSFGK